MARIKIKDLPKDMKISGKELTAIHGGGRRPPTGLIIESGSFQSSPGTFPISGAGKAIYVAQVASLKLR